MKKISIITLFISTLLFTSCNSIAGLANSSSVSSSATAITAGATCGNLLKTLYTQYKSTGKVDLTSSSNLVNAMQLGTYCNTLKNNKNNSAYLSTFAQGLVSGSGGLISTGKSMSTVSSLLSLPMLSAMKSSVSGSSTSGVASALTTLFSSLNK
jgi:hypothetical protein